MGRVSQQNVLALACRKRGACTLAACIHGQHRRRALINIVPVSLSLSLSNTHTHLPLPLSKWLMALRTMTSAMSGMLSLAWALARVCMCEYLCVSAYLMSAGLIHTHLPPDNWNHTTRLLTSSHQHTHTHTKLIRSVHYCWIMLFSSAATGFSLWV